MVDIRVLRGSPSDEELAALVTVLALLSQSTVDEPEPVVSAWHRVPRPRTSPEVGEGAWRASGLPR